MAEHQRDDAVEARLRDFLAAELRRAEDDYARLDAVVRARQRSAMWRPRGFAAVASAVAVVTVLVAGVFGIVRLAGPSIGGPAVIPMGDDGLPLSIDGEHVERLGDMVLRDADRGYLVGGTLMLNTGPCNSGSARAQLGCGEDWTLVAGPADDPTMTITLDGAPTAPGFVRTSGALTVIRVGAPSAVDGVLAVTSIAWRQPTKGPIPNEATPPEGGDINEALVPDFVPMLGPDGVTIAGYVPKRYILDGPETTPGGTPSNPPQSLPIPVYGEDLVTLVGHSVPGVGFVALGATETPSPFDFSQAPATEAPATEAPEPAPSSSSATMPPVDCGRIEPLRCARAVDLARSVDREGETRGTSQVVVDDTCPPAMVCRRQYLFEALVVFVTAGTDTTGWVPFEVTGLDPGVPSAATRFMGELPEHLVARLRAPGDPASVGTFRFDIVNRSSFSVALFVESDAGRATAGFGPGERGTVYVRLRNPTTGITIDILGWPACGSLGSTTLPGAVPLTLLLDDDARPPGLVLTTEPGTFPAPQPLPVTDHLCR